MSPNKELNGLARRERLRAIRTWCFGLGVAACGLVLLPPNTSLIANPDAWGPTGGIRFFVAPFLAAPFYFTSWFAISALVLGITLLLAGVILTLLLRRHAEEEKN